ncbi:MAG: hypothetical protein ACK5Y2_01230 [Bdellovibrionales bacterium]
MRYFVPFVLLAALLSAQVAGAEIPFKLHFSRDSLRFDPESEGFKSETSESRIPISLLASRILRNEKRTLSVSRKYIFDQELKVRLPELEARLQALFEAALQGSQGQKPQTLSGEILIPEKMEFLRNLLGSPSLEDRALVEAFFLNPRRKQGLQSAHEKTLANMIPQAQDSSFFVDPALWSLSELRELSAGLAGSAHEILDLKTRILVGRGASLWALRKIVQQSEQLQDPELARLSGRAFHFATQNQIRHLHRFTFESAAQYDPMTEEILFSRLSRATLNVWVHEVEHARFQKFSARLQKWLTSRNYALPFHIDGFDSERAGFFGDLYLILNEINSWRKDLPLSGSRASAEKRVLELYLQAVGPKTRELLQKTDWISSVWQDSVAEFLRHEIKQLNQLQDLEILPELEKALVEENLMRAISLRRLAQKRAVSIPETLDRELTRQQQNFERAVEKSQELNASEKDGVPTGVLRAILEQERTPTREELRDFDRRFAEALLRPEVTGLDSEVLLKITQQLTPEDLPFTFQQVLKIFRDSNELDPQHRRVRIFLAFDVRPDSGAFVWSERLAEALESDTETRRLSDRTLEALFLFYERSLPRLWKPGESWESLAPQVQARVRRAALILQRYQRATSGVVSLGAQAVFQQQPVYTQALQASERVSAGSCQSLLSRSSGF